LACRCWMLARKGRKKCSMGPRSPSLPTESQRAFFQLLTSRAPTFRLCKCLTTGSAQCETQNAHSVTSEAEGGKNQTLCKEGSLWSSERINPQSISLLLSLHASVWKSDRSRQEGSYENCPQFLSSASAAEAYKQERLAFLLVTARCLSRLHFFMQLFRGIVNALSSSWAALLFFGVCTFSCSPVALSKLTESCVYVDKDDIILW